MTDTPSHDMIATKIAALLNSRRAGQEVADYLERQSAEPSRRTTVVALRTRRPERRAREACESG